MIRAVLRKVGASNLRELDHMNPLKFTLGADAVDPALLTAEASGAVFSQIELAGYSGTGSDAVLVTDNVSKDAAIDALTAGDAGESVSLRYGDAVRRFYPTGANGHALAPTVAGYDKITGSSDTSTSNVNGTPGKAPDAPLSGTPQTTDTSAPPLPSRLSRTITGARSTMRASGMEHAPPGRPWPARRGWRAATRLMPSAAASPGVRSAGRREASCPSGKQVRVPLFPEHECSVYQLAFVARSRRCSLTVHAATPTAIRGAAA